MPSTPDNEAFNYAERIRARLPRTLQEEREAAGLSKYALEKKSSVSREMISASKTANRFPPSMWAHGWLMALE